MIAGAGSQRRPRPSVVVQTNVRASDAEAEATMQAISRALSGAGLDCNVDVHTACEFVPGPFFGGANLSDEPAAFVDVSGPPAWRGPASRSGRSAVRAAGKEAGGPAAVGAVDPLVSHARPASRYPVFHSVRASTRAGGGTRRGTRHPNGHAEIVISEAAAAAAPATGDLTRRGGGANAEGSSLGTEPRWPHALRRTVRVCVGRALRSCIAVSLARFFVRFVDDEPCALRQYMADVDHLPLVGRPARARTQPGPGECPRRVPLFAGVAARWAPDRLLPPAGAGPQRPASAEQAAPAGRGVPPTSASPTGPPTSPLMTHGGSTEVATVAHASDLSRRFDSDRPRHASHAGAPSGDDLMGRKLAWSAGASAQGASPADAPPHALATASRTAEATASGATDRAPAAMARSSSAGLLPPRPRAGGRAAARLHSLLGQAAASAGGPTQASAPAAPYVAAGAGPDAHAESSRAPGVHTSSSEAQLRWLRQRQHRAHSGGAGGGGGATSAALAASASGEAPDMALRSRVPPLPLPFDRAVVPNTSPPTGAALVLSAPMPRSPHAHASRSAWPSGAGRGSTSVSAPVAVAAAAVAVDSRELFRARAQEAAAARKRERLERRLGLGAHSAGARRHGGGGSALGSGGGRRVGSVGSVVAADSSASASAVVQPAFGVAAHRGPDLVALALAELREEQRRAQSTLAAGDSSGRTDSIPLVPSMVASAAAPSFQAVADVPSRPHGGGVAGANTTVVAFPAEPADRGGVRGVAPGPLPIRGRTTTSHGRAATGGVAGSARMSARAALATRQGRV